MAFQEEKIKEELGQERDSRFILFIGIVVSLIGYIVYDFHINRYRTLLTGRKVLLSSEYPYQFIGILLIIIGIVIISIGIAKKIFSRVWDLLGTKIPCVFHDIGQTKNFIYRDFFLHLKNELKNKQ